MVWFLKFVFALGATIASGNSLRKREINVPAMAPMPKKKMMLRRAKTGKGSSSDSSAKTGKGSSSDSSAKTSKGFSSENTMDVMASGSKFEGRDIKAFWEGRDFPEERLSLKLLAPDDGMEAQRNVHIFGLQDSGTSLLKALLYANFGHRLNYFDGAFWTNSEPNERKGLWKHSSFKELARVEHDLVHRLNEAEVHTISVVRNPYSWLDVVRTGNGPMWKECIQGDDWLIKPCSHPSPGGKDSMIDNMEFQSIAGIWNHWTEGFKKAENYGFNRSLLVKYEDLVLRPRDVLARIRDFLEMKKWGDWTIPFDEPEREEPLQSVTLGSFMNDFLQVEKRQACLHLDPDVVSLLEYRTFDCSLFTKGPGHKSGSESQ